jgi:hypothetical protein
MNRHKLLAFCSSRTSRRNLCRIVVLAMGLVLVCLPQGRAGGVVTSCNENSLRTALSGGRLVTFECSGTITLTATITISANTTIDGTGQNVTISGGNAVQVFAVPTGVKLNLNKLTIAYGFGVGGFGGGIYNRGTLTVTNSTFSGNTAPPESGVAVGGGGIFNTGTLTVTNSTFSGNSAVYGAGIANFGGTGAVTNSAFSGNSAAFGGGIENFNFGSGASLTVTNSTFSGNSAPDGGGGIDNSGTLTVTNSTFSGNSADPSCCGPGGGISNGGTLTLQNTIVANSPLGGNCYGSLIDGGGNLVTDNTCGTIPASPDPLLGPLQYNGGRTQTMVLGAGSPAIGNGLEANCPIRDQRGFPRPFTSNCSIGAYEPGTLFASFHGSGAVNLATQSLSATGTFTLGADNDGAINPVTDLVQFRFGTFSATVPPGSFQQTTNGSFVCNLLLPGIVHGPQFTMTIQPLGGNKYSFAASAQLVNLTGTVAPIIVQLTIGDDGGTTHAPAEADD